MKTKKLLWLLLVVATMVAAFAFTASATDNASEPTLKIEGGNLSFEDSVFILYAVSHEGIAAEDVRLYFWNEPQSGKNAYAYDTADYSFAPYQQNVTVAGKSCVTFRNNTLRAKNMTDYVYARAYAEVDGVGYYSQVSKYSILQYAYNQLGKTAAGTSKQALKDMLTAMLEYGAAAQIYFDNYHADRLANADYYQIKVEGGTLADGFNKGLFLEGEKVTITAPETDGELVFSEWVNSAGESVSADLTAEITVGEANETYTAVYVEAVRYSEGLQFVSNGDGTCYVSGIGTCTDTDLKIPPTSPSGEAVIGIGYNAFSENTAITSVRLPEGLLYIFDLAFQNCTSLTTISMPNSVVSIGNNAFRECSKLEDFALSNSVKSIGEGAFYNCTGLKLLMFGNSVETIMKSAFEKCTGVTDLTIPNSVTRIGGYAFRGCTSLKNVTIDSCSPEIGDGAFYGCTNVENIYISDIAAWCRTRFLSCKANPLYYASNLYLSGDLVTDLVIPDSVTSIGASAFYNYAALTSITIPSSVISIDDSAFGECVGLQGVYITDLSAWCKINFKGSTANPLYYAKKLYLNSKLLNDLVIPEGITAIPASAFIRCNTLTSVTLSASITSIGNGAFTECTALKGVYISDLAAWCGIEFANFGANPLYYAKKLYLNNELVTDLVIPEGVAAIQGYAFYYYPELISVAISDTVTVIKNYAFGDCKNLASIILSNSVTDIETGAFYSCSKLTSVFYKGRAEGWNKIFIDANNDSLINATRYYYSENQPTETGNYWHYVDGEIVIWPKYLRDGDYIYFGEYPQTVKTSDVTITSTQDARGYYLGSDGFYYARILALTYPYESTYVFSTGETAIYGNEYYFKVEPLRWRILTEDNEKALILCDSVISAQAYDGGRDNNYAESLIREWLNETFYQTAFSNFQNQIIQLTLVDNSEGTTGFSPNEKACEDTEDNLFLLSYADVTNVEYGFNENGAINDSNRKLLASDYAIAGGLTPNSENFAPWWLRSPHNRGADLARFITSNGSVGNYSIYYSSYGVAPALWITL